MRLKLLVISIILGTYITGCSTSIAREHELDEEAKREETCASAYSKRDFEVALRLCEALANQGNPDG